MVNHKIKTNKNKKFDQKLVVVEDSTKETLKRLEMENQKKLIMEQNNRVFEKNGDVKPFDFNDIDQQDDEINLNKILDLAESNKTEYYRTTLSEVIDDSQ